MAVRDRHIAALEERVDEAQRRARALAQNVAERDLHIAALESTLRHDPVAITLDDGRTFGRTLVRSGKGLKSNAWASWLGKGTGATAAGVALLALAFGAILALSPHLGPLLATLIVVGFLLAIAALAGWRAHLSYGDIRTALRRDLTNEGIDTDAADA